METKSLTRKETAALRKAAEALHETDRDYKRAVNLRFFVSLVCVILAALAIRQYVGEPFLVQGSSMHPTLLGGERMLIEKITYTFSRPARGDIVVCDYPGRTENFVKRVIGLPGDIVEISGGKVYINGIALNEGAYWEGNIRNDFPPHQVEEGRVFVMGDNRNNSRDSRYADVGDIVYEEIIGKAVIVIWPVTAWRGLT